MLCFVMHTVQNSPLRSSTYFPLIFAALHLHSTYITSPSSTWFSSLYQLVWPRIFSLRLHSAVSLVFFFQFSSSISFLPIWSHEVFLNLLCALHLLSLCPLLIYLQFVTSLILSSRHYSNLCILILSSYKGPATGSCLSVNKAKRGALSKPLQLCIRRDMLSIRKVVGKICNKEMRSGAHSAARTVHLVN
jgi:hypothetical protein